jgi:ubiquinol-cytochrome c reductase cytochrome b subunit
LKRLLDALDERTGYRRLVALALDEPIPGGARWAYVFGSALVGILAIQIVTGLCLMAVYSPSAAAAWGSVWWIENRVTLGWLVRGMHHHAAGAMVVVLAMHLVQVAIYGAYKKPREVNWIVGIKMLGVTLALALTGYLLPWDQKGYWATQVATSIAGTVPGVGAWVERLLVGGAEYGTPTLTRFYALHVGVLPACLVLLLAVHVYLFRRHGVTPPASADLSRVGRFHPDQLLRDLAAAFACLAFVVAMAVRGHGAPLDAPADPSSDYPARPDWYFLFLFQLLKYFEGPLEVVGTVVMPLVAAAWLFGLPWIDRAGGRAIRARLVPVGSIVVGLFAIGALTLLAVRDDAGDARLQERLRQARALARRASALAARGIPVEGAQELLARDPRTRGPALFAEHCEACHGLGGWRGERKASDLAGFGSAAWVKALVRDPNAERFFGHTKLRGMDPFSPQDLPDADLDAVAAHVAGESSPRGRAVFGEKCIGCHLWNGQGRDLGLAEGPELSGWASRAWILAQLLDPAHPSRYGESNEMPRFGDRMDEPDLRVLVEYLTSLRDLE